MFATISHELPQEAASTQEEEEVPQLEVSVDGELPVEVGPTITLTLPLPLPLSLMNCVLPTST